MVVSRFAGPDDIPKTGSSEVFGQVLFAKEKVEYHGQILGLIVAESQVSSKFCVDSTASLPHCLLITITNTTLAKCWASLSLNHRYQKSLYSFIVVTVTKPLLPSLTVPSALLLSLPPSIVITVCVVID